MASAGLTYALNNGSTKEQYYKQIFDAFATAQSQGLSDAQIEIGMNQYGISADDLAQATGVTPESVQTRMDVATPTTAADLAYERAAQAELATRQAQEDARLASLLETAPTETPVSAPITVPTGLLETPITTPVATPVVAPVTAPVSLLETQVTAPVVATPVTTGSNMATSAALNYALNNGMTKEQYYKNIFDYVNQNRGLNDVQLRAEMDRLGVSAEDVASATRVPLAGVQTRYNVADEGTGGYVAPVDIPASVGLTYGLNNNMTQAQIDKNIFDFVNANRGLNDVQLAAEMDRLGISPNDVARATGVSYESVAGRYNAAKTGNVGGTGNTAITDVFNQYVTPTGTITPTTITPTTVVPTTVVPTTVTPITGTPVNPVITAGQMRELFPSFAESKRLAGEMVANRPSTNSIINMIQGANISPTYRPPPVNTMPTGLMDAWSAAEKSGNYGAVANMLKGVSTNDLRNYGASAADIAYITSRPQIAGMFPTATTTATPSLNNVLSMIGK